MKRLARCLLALCACANLAQAQTQTTPNLINPAGTAWGIPDSQVLNTSGITAVEGGGVYVPGTAYYNSDTNTIRFGYMPSTVAQTIAINTALQGSGIQINGFNWKYQWMNGGFSSGSLGVAIQLSDPIGNTLESQTMSHARQAEATWNTEQGTKTFTNPYAIASTGYLSMAISGQDDRFWMGLYGPRVRDTSLSFNYALDQCAANPLSSPTCPNYATAFFNQQCTISALYNPACPGYAVAYFTQQCTINPLADPLCPGYQQAYKTQQCSINPLYATDCPGYAAAYKSQQCSINPLYATDCPGYQQAYKTQQCSINPLYATDCPGYAQAYYTQQCTANALYDSGCPGYQAAYAKKNVLGIGTNTTTTTAAATAVVTESAPSTAKTDPISIATTSTTTSTTSPTSVTSVTSVVSGGSTNATTAVITSTSTQSTTAATTTAPTTTTEAKKTDNEVRSVTSTTTSGTASRDTAKTRAETVARQVAREASEAKTFEAQAATQSLVVGLMGFVPGFDAYGQTRIVDVNAQQMARLYNRPTVDNRQALRRLTGASDRLHTEMVDQQFQLGR